MNGDFLFTSESVTEGHPDKVCDQISDGVLDEVLKQDPTGRVACETFATVGLVIVGGEITTRATVDIHSIVRRTLKEIGYTQSATIPVAYLTRLARNHRTSPKALTPEAPVIKG